MFRSPAAAATLWLSLGLMFVPAAAAAQDPPAAPQPPAPDVRSITITGAKELSPAVVRAEAGVREGAPLGATTDDIARRIRRAYRDEGYTFATATVEFDADTGALTIAIDEGRIDGVSFEGVESRLARMFADEFALRAGDVFNSRRARHALDVLLAQTRGAVRASRIYSDTPTDTGELRRRGTFDIVDRGGQRILLVGLREQAGQFRLVPDFGEREDWFSSVDGANPSLGMGIAVFDRDRFNHAFIAGHLSYKFAAERAGYALGFERPLFGMPKLYVGAELHDLTATDDHWQVSSSEASEAAVFVRRSFRDYYRRKGAQVNATLRLHPQLEALFAWRGEQHDPLSVRTDFSVWRDDEAFPLNRPAAPGRLNSIVVGASFDGRGFDRESLEATYRRHQLETPFGERLNGLDDGSKPDPVWRVDWTSEISDPGAFGGDFDFRRHIVTARGRAAITEHEVVAARAIGGWSNGVLPPQRQFSIGGIGSVHGYDFKAQTGDTLALLNVEYEVGWRGGLKAVAFFDAGRVTSRPTLTTPSPADAGWLKGVGFGVGIADIRVDFGYRTDDIPGSLQVLLRLGRSF